MREAVIIQKLTTFSLFFCLLIRIIKRCKIYYIEPAGRFRGKLDRIIFFEKWDIYWINRIYSEYSEYRKWAFVARELTDSIFSQVKESKFIIELEMFLCVDGILHKKMDVLWKKRIYEVLEPFAHQIAAADYFLKKEKVDRVTIVSSRDFSILLKTGFFSNNITIHFSRFLEGIGLLNIFFKQYSTVWRRVFTFRNKNPRSLKPLSTGYGNGEINTENVEVVFFPHKGINYGDLFVKDHFYNEDPESSFHKSKILHISLWEKNESYIIKSHKFYHTNNIPYIDMADIDVSIQKIIKECIRLILKDRVSLISFIHHYGVMPAFFFFLSFFKIKSYIETFSRFSNLKVALVGYAFLFPIELAMALSILKIQVCASQERFIHAFFPQAVFILDYYFVSGNVVQEIGLKNSSINHCIPVGLVRVDQIYDYEKLNIPDDKYDLIKKKQKLILALDYHLPVNDFEDLMRPVAKIRQTRRFYEDLINLAQEFPEIHVVIKGKDTESYKSPYIKDIMERIVDADNVSVEMDLKRYNPYYLSEKADLTIACYTSLADELLAAGRPVIFYESSDYLETIFNYEHLPIIVYDFRGLKFHVENFFKGKCLDEDMQTAMIRKYYSDCYHGKVREKIQTYLKNITDN